MVSFIRYHIPSFSFDSKLIKSFPTVILGKKYKLSYVRWLQIQWDPLMKRMESITVYPSWHMHQGNNWTLYHSRKILTQEQDQLNLI